jgi:hypothetical protein
MFSQSRIAAGAPDERGTAVDVRCDAAQCGRSYVKIDYMADLSTEFGEQI